MMIMRSSTQEAKNLCQSMMMSLMSLIYINISIIVMGGVRLCELISSQWNGQTGTWPDLELKVKGTRQCGVRTERCPHHLIIIMTSG